MKTKSSRRRRNAEEWREIIRRQAESGLSVERFCRRDSISVYVFREWRRRLGAAALPVKSRFVELTPGTDKESVRVELQLPNGAILRIA